MQNTEQKPQPELERSKEGSTEKPSNEYGSFAIGGVVKIFDPETQQVYVETRA